MTPEGTEWLIERVLKVTDGDTIRVIRCQRSVFDGLEQITRDSDPLHGQAIRLITLDTPERGEDGYDLARLDVQRWLTYESLDRQLHVTTWPGGGFDRLLGDVWAGDRSNTLSQWMLRHGNNGAGWLPYVRGA